MEKIKVNLYLSKDKALAGGQAEYGHHALELSSANMEFLQENHSEILDFLSKNLEYISQSEYRKKFNLKKYFSFDEFIESAMKKIEEEKKEKEEKEAKEKKDYEASVSKIRNGSPEDLITDRYPYGGYTVMNWVEKYREDPRCNKLIEAAEKIASEKNENRKREKQAREAEQTKKREKQAAREAEQTSIFLKELDRYVEQNGTESMVERLEAGLLPHDEKIALLESRLFAPWDDFTRHEEITEAAMIKLVEGADMEFDAESSEIIDIDAKNAGITADEFEFYKKIKDCAPKLEREYKIEPKITFGYYTCEESDETLTLRRPYVRISVEWNYKDFEILVSLDGANS